MPGFKQSVVSTSKGISVEQRPVVISLSLTQEQQALIIKATGQASPQYFELSASDLRVVLAPQQQLLVKFW